MEQPNFKITAQGGSGTGALSYAIKTDSNHIASIAGDTITYTKAGTITITATKAEDNTYSEIVSEKTITIQKAKQNIEITNGDFKLGSASNFKITIAGRATTLTTPLAYALTQGDEFAILSGDTITPSKVGSIEVSVTSKGDAVYEDCTVKKTINIANKDPQTPLQITNTNKFAYDVDDPTFEIETSGGSGSGALTYTIKEDVNNIASISGNIVTYNKTGSFIITATKASDSTYQESTAEKAITIDKLKQTITITNTDFKLGSANDFKITVDSRDSTLTQPLIYALTLGKGDVASIVGDTITPIKAGIIEISVTSPGDDIYEDFTITKQIQLIEKDKQTPLVITNTGSFTYDKDNANFEITTSGGSGTGAITYAIKEDSNHIASISGNTITYAKAGSFTITATKSGDDTYQESTVEKTFEIKKIKQVLTITNGTFVIGTASNFKIDVEGHEASLLQPLTYDITIGKDSIASIVDDTITPIKAGMIEISVTSLGDDIYEDFTITKQIQLLEKENQTPLVITNTEKRVYNGDALSFDITTSGGSGSGAMTYEIVEDDDHIVSISGKTITYVKPGTFTIRAMKASDSAYKESIAEKTITIEKMKQEDFAISNTDFIITSAANFTITTINRPSELSDAIIYDISVGKGSVASIVDDVVTPITTGNITITATSKGNDFYEDCTVEKQIEITRLPIQNPEISIRNGASVVYGSNNNNLQIQTTGGQGNGAITYDVTPTDVASIDNTTGLVTIKKVGTFTVTATKSGSGVYSNSIARKTIVVEQGEQTAFEISNTDFIYQSAPDFKITTRGRLNELTDTLVYDVTQGKGDVVRIVADTITPLKVGVTTISVYSKGNENYKDKTVEKQISITNLPAQDVALNITNTDVTWGDENNTLQITTSGGQGDGVITYELQAGDEDNAAIDHNTGLVQIKKAGIFHVTARKSGNGIYQDAQASKTITVNPMDITITPKPITKKVHQMWTSIPTFDYDVSPALIQGDTLLGNAIYAYANGVNDDSPVGSYSYTIRGLSSPNYAITFEEGTLYVEKDILDEDELAAYYRIKSGTKGLQNWYTSNVVFESLKKDGYDLISDTQTFIDSEFMVSNEGSFASNIYFKNNNGSITEPIQIPLKIDKSAPIMEEIILHEKNTNPLAKFINTLSFGNWFKQEVEVEFIGTDNLSDVTFLYQEEIDGVLGEWKTTSDTISYQNGASVILHVKAMDEAGNESVDTRTSDLIQIDLDAPIIQGIEDEKSYYLPRLVNISDANSGLNMDASYFVNVSKKALHEQTFFNGIGDISLHVEDYAGNNIDAQFHIQGLPPLDSIIDDDASRDIVKEIEKEYDDIKDSITDEKQKQEIEDWLEKAKDKSKKYVDVVEEVESGIIVDGDGNVVFEEDIELVVEVVTAKIQNEKIDLEEFEGLDKDDEIKVAYDIYLKKGDEKVQPQGMVKVKIPNTKDLQQIEGLKLVYIDNVNVVTLYPSAIDKDYIVFSTDHFSNYAIVGKRSKLNIDVDKDGVLDLNIDTDKDGLPDLNLDSDDDGEADLNVDSNGDFLPDIDIDTNGDGKADVNIDVNGDGVADLNIAQRITRWEPDKDCTVNGFAYDTDGSIIGNINVDSDGDGEADTNVDTDGDGVPDSNLDDYWKNILSKGNDNDSNGIGGVISGDESRWTSWWITVVLALSTMIASRMLTKKWKVAKKQK